MSKHSTPHLHTLYFAFNNFTTHILLTNISYFSLRVGDLRFSDFGLQDTNVYS